MMAYDDNNIFARILRGEIPCKKVHEDAHTLAFEDIHPQAPTHLLIIPKQHIASQAKATAEHAPLLGHLLATAAKIARRIGSRCDLRPGNGDAFAKSAGRALTSATFASTSAKTGNGCAALACSHSKQASTLPNRIRSPARSVTVVITCPLTRVPLVESRSFSW